MDWPAGASTYLVKSLLRYAICMHVQPYACMCMYNGSSLLKPLEGLSKKQQNPADEASTRHKAAETAMASGGAGVLTIAIPTR